MSKKQASASANSAGKGAKRENTQLIRHKLTPAMEARKWKPGQSGNPGGRPKRDLAAEIARAVFEQDPAKLIAVFTKKLRKGDAKAFGILAERGYGKTPQPVNVDGEIENNVTVRFENVAALSEP